MLKNSASKLGTKHELTVWLKISAAQVNLLKLINMLSKFIRHL